jgi:hypothetical protein
MSALVSTQDIPQRVWPALQPLEHEPAMALHTGVPPEHARPHAPQFIAVLSGVSQPLVALPSQLAKPALHDATTQPPAEHPATALGSEQDRPQEPQFPTSVLVSTQDIPQRVWPAPQPLEHMPVMALHTGVAPEHARPHAPQFIVELSAVSQPFAGFASQSPKPVEHA